MFLQTTVKNNLGQWVANQRSNYRFYQEGKPSPMTPSRIQELEIIGLEWGTPAAAWVDKNTKLANWVANRRRQCRLRQEGQRSQMTLPRLLELESLGFEWKLSIDHRKGAPKKSSRVHKTPANSRQVPDSQLETAPSNIILRATGYY
jgi:hypothetical protein